MDIVSQTAIPYGMLGRLLRMRWLRQFVKFCLVGATSTVIQMGVYRLLWLPGEPAWVHQVALPSWLTPKDLYTLIANSIGFCLAVTNGFFWNRKWTFKGVHRRAPKTQYLLFFGVNIVGLTLSSAIVYTIVKLLHGHIQSHVTAGQIGQLMAAPVVAIWNFTANRRWTFAAPPADE